MKSFADRITGLLGRIEALLPFLSAHERRSLWQDLHVVIGRVRVGRRVGLSDTGQAAVASAFNSAEIPFCEIGCDYCPHSSDCVPFQEIKQS